ncbi:MAG: hypothetical protein MJ211_02990 [Bacteroidales bacterium]|nr:hypothetical protein [Bacteroidales bacterium]
MRYLFISIILLISLVKNAYSQSFFHNFNSSEEFVDEYNTYLNSYNIKNYHSAIYPHFKQNNEKINNQLDINLLHDLSIGGDNKNIIYNSLLGISADYSLNNKLSANYSFIVGINKFPNYLSILSDSIKYIAGAGDFKKSGENYKMFYQEFYLNYNCTPYLNFIFGKGKKFIGDGFRSMFLSESNSGMYYFDTHVNIDNFKYIFSVNYSKSLDTENNHNRSKYFIYHLISWNLTKNINLGGFEAVVLSRRDSLDNSKFVDLHYINPVLFLRPIEYSLGSPDNVLMGIFGKITIKKLHFLYGQVMLDEFNSSFLKGGKDWWADKFSYQLGAKGYINNFLYRIEYNFIRPYMYSHENAITSYTMFSQPIAHPFGANLKEYVAQLRYVKNKFDFNLIVDYVKYGSDFDTISYGNNILRSYVLRKNDYDNYILQGKLNKLVDISFTTKYQLIKNKNIFAYLSLVYRRETENNYFIQLGFKTDRFFFDRNI